MTNTTSSQVASDYGGERDGGDVMSTINPDDIASITLLKGAAASALYGAVAANGAIMITTKSAMAGKVSVNVSSNTTMEAPMVLPEFQTTYAAVLTAHCHGATSSLPLRRTMLRNSSAQDSPPTTLSRLQVATTTSSHISLTATSTLRA